MPKIKEITGKENATDIISVLKQKTVDVIPWEELKKEYDPKLHPVMTDPNYRDQHLDDGSIEKVSRIILGFQRLAANRMTQLTFGIPVKRIYKFENDKEKQKAARILEDIMMQNRIESMNMQRGVMLFAGCEFASLWYGVKSENTYYAGEKSPIKIRCRNYSPMDDRRISFAQNANLYPYFDEYDDMTAMSFEYSRKVGDKTVNYFDVYTDIEHIRYSNQFGEWNEDTQSEVIGIEKIPGIYCYRPTPIWEDSSGNLYEAEWTLSRSGNYLRKNSKPILSVSDDNEIKYGEEESEKKEFRTVFQLSQNGKMAYVTWEQAIEALKYQVQEIKQNYFTELQLPDLSSESLKVSNVSADALEIMLLDSQLKVTQESGILLDFFYREMNVVKALAKKAYPELSNAFDSLLVEFIITPYFINDDEKKTNNLSTATGGKAFMSRLEAIKQLNYVENAELELKQIQKEEEFNLSDPTNEM